jgi:hypothetical protein
MRVILSLAAIGLIYTSYTTGPLSAGALLIAGALLGLILLGFILFLIGKKNPRPRQGQVGYIGKTKVVVLACFDSYEQIPEQLKLLNTDPVKTDEELFSDWVVTATRNGKVIISPHFSAQRA